MGSSRRFATAMLVAAAVGAATIGVTAAVADQDQGRSTGYADGELLERLGTLETQLPDALEELSDEHDLAAYADDIANLRGVLRPVEDDLRRLFVDADDSDGPAADPVALVARGWLDLLHASESLAVWASHDLAFPLDTTDDDGVATGADDLRGLVDKGLRLYVDGRDRHLEGYAALRDLGAAEAPDQNQLDNRAAEAELFDRVDRPQIAVLFSNPSSTVLVPLERFDTQGPGVESRAGSMSYVCVDRDLLEATEDPLTDEVLLELEAASPERQDCGLDVLTPDED